MKFIKVSYGRTIEVGGPFGRRPVEKVWFGWDVEVDVDLISEKEVTERLRAKADEREEEEKALYRERLRERQERVDLARKARGSYVIRKGGLADPGEYLQHSSLKQILWGPYESAFVSTSQDDANAYAERRGVKDYGLFPGPRR